MNDITFEKRLGSDDREYLVSSLGTWYNKDTPEKVALVLEKARVNHWRVRIWNGYKDEETSNIRHSEFAPFEAWTDEFEVYGTVGRSCGDIKIPILSSSRRSTGGFPILDSCVIRIDSEHSTLYKAEGFHFPQWKMSDDGYSLLYKTEKMNEYRVYANCPKDKSQTDARRSLGRLLGFMTGARYAK